MSVPEAYAEAARAAKTRDRAKSEWISLRRASNFVKEALWSVSFALWKKIARLECIRVVDFACGRGGDLGKVARAARQERTSLNAYIGLDWSDVALEEARQRMKTYRVSGSVHARDLRALNALEGTEIALEQAQVAGCMFALHYFFETADHFTTFIHHVSTTLQDGGLFLTVYSDGEMLARLFAKSRSIRIGTAGLEMDADAHTRFLSSKDPFGHRYRVFIPDSVFGVDEFLVHTPSRDKICADHHLHCILDVPAPHLLKSMLQRSHWQSLFQASDMPKLHGNAMRLFSLYRVAIFVKDPMRVNAVKAQHAINRMLHVKP